MEGDADYLRNHVHPPLNGLADSPGGSASMSANFPPVAKDAKRVGSPATIVDCHGRILVWLLPSVFADDQVRAN